tara:strand:+ start:393 stop:701 length:309 start_codon:yes stop_codon:yes gene_type:complete
MKSKTIKHEPSVILRVASRENKDDRTSIVELSKAAPQLPPGVVWQIGMGIQCFDDSSDKFIVCEVHLLRDGSVHVWLDAWDRDDHDASMWIEDGWLKTIKQH